jgi:hypothetical protein
MTVLNQSEQLAKAAKHYEKAGKHYREASEHESHSRDAKADREARLGAEHAVQAHQYADDAAKERVTEPASCCS